MMKKQTFFIGLFFSLSAFATLIDSGDVGIFDHFTVPQVDLNSYAGQWYEIALLPYSFEKDCARDTTALYTPLGHGQLEVRNSCFSSDGGQKISMGRAQVENTETNAELKVSFTQIFGKWIYWFAGDYDIIGLGPNYQWAVVGNRNLKYGWILSRTPQMNDEDFIQAEQVLKDKGYNICNFVTTPQAPPYERHSLCDQTSTQP